MTSAAGALHPRRGNDMTHVVRDGVAIHAGNRLHEGYRP